MAVAAGGPLRRDEGLFFFELSHQVQGVFIARVKDHFCHRLYGTRQVRNVDGVVGLAAQALVVGPKLYSF